jgi:hypothetical protein
MPRTFSTVVAALVAASILTACGAGRPSSGDGVDDGTQATTSPASQTPFATPAPPTAIEPSPRADPPTSAAGITGVTVIDGGCPVLRAESPCPDRPVTATVSVLDAATESVVATINSDDHGYFRVTVKPGRYLLRPVSVAGGPPRRPGTQTVTVEPNRFTTVTVRFDSGIR